MTLIEAEIRRAHDEGSLIGICEWADGEAELWGQITRLSDFALELDELNSLGQPDGKSTIEFEDIYALSDNYDYAVRLRLLKDFSPTHPFTDSMARKPKGIREALEKGLASQEFLTLEVKGEGRRASKVLDLSESEAKIQTFGDLGIPTQEMTLRLTMITGARIGTASEEAEAYLAGLRG